MDNKKSWGWHTIVDASQCSHDAITDYDTIYNFSKQLVKEIDMVPFGEPQIVKFGSGDKEGYTLVQLIETSNITAHFVDDVDAVFLDVFSCKEYDTTVVEKLVRDYFKAEYVDIRKENREYKPTINGRQNKIFPAGKIQRLFQGYSVWFGHGIWSGYWRKHQKDSSTHSGNNLRV